LRVDFTVAGLGPAGSMAAYELARRGYRVEGYDFQARYRKVCGDALTIREDYRRLVEEAGVILTSVRNYSVGVEGEEVAYVSFSSDNWHIIDKGGLVSYLRSLAEAEGAILHKGRAPSPRGEGIYVDARGPYAHFSGRSSVHVMVYRGLARVPAGSWDPESALLDFVPGEAGLFWVFPHDEKTVNFGAGFRGRSLSYSKGVSLRKLAELVGEFEVVDEGAAPIAAWAPVLLVDSNIVKVGEAGGLVNSVAGEGNRLALLSAQALGEAASTGRSLVPEYHRLVGPLAAEARLSRVLLRVVESAPGGGEILQHLPGWFWRRYLMGRLDLDVVLGVFVERPELALITLHG